MNCQLGLNLKQNPRREMLIHSEVDSVCLCLRAALISLSRSLSAARCLFTLGLRLNSNHYPLFYESSKNKVD